MTELEDFNRELIADIQGSADVGGTYLREAFFEKMGEVLTEAGELEGADYSYYEGTGKQGVSLQIDGLGGDPRESDGILNLILCDFEASEGVRQFIAEDIKSRFNRVIAFLKHALTDKFREKLEETSAGFMLADLISTTWPSVDKVKLILITNAENRSRIDGVPIGQLENKNVTCSVWDLKRIEKFVRSGQARENLLIDFNKDFGGPLPVLKASMGDSSLESYIAVIRGSQLSDIYDRWGTRLLESNVRSFLQARGKVNRNMRDTLEQNPEMFFAYNNGLTATADKVSIRKTEVGTTLLRAENLQIVNGGQTTASIHAARKQRPNKPKAQLDEVYVYMKLNVVPPDVAVDLVPKISLYSNSQNKINDADLASNHPFQMRLQEFSRRILAPKGNSSYHETKWFYERARGQYPDERGRRTVAERKKFDIEYPRSQYFNKTDLAKFLNSWDGLPYFVSQGAQKNFVKFQGNIAAKWKKSEAQFDESWYKRTIAKAIIFKTIERFVPKQIWYEGGFRANIVTYSIAKLAYDLTVRNYTLDLDKVWKMQMLPNEVTNAFLLAAKEANVVITHPPIGIRNMSEWAKKNDCWIQLKEKEIVYDDDLYQFIISL